VQTNSDHCSLSETPFMFALAINLPKSRNCGFCVWLILLSRVFSFVPFSELCASSCQPAFELDSHFSCQPLFCLFLFKIFFQQYLNCWLSPADHRADKNNSLQMVQACAGLLQNLLHLLTLYLWINSNLNEPWLIPPNEVKLTSSHLS